LALGVLVALCLLGGIWIAVTTQRNGLPGLDYYRLKVQLADAQSLGRSGAEVRIAGRLVGQTEGSSIVRGVPTVRLRLQPGNGPLPVDTKAILRPRGLLGTQYIDLVPGRSVRDLSDGAVIPRRQTDTFVQLTEIFDTFDRPTRAAFQETFRGLGNGFAGRGDGLNATLAIGPPTLRDLSAAIEPLLRRGAVPAFLRGAASLGTTAEPVREEIADGFVEGERALRPFAEEGHSVSRLLDVAPSGLRETRLNLRQTDTLLDSTTRFARAATRFTRPAPAGLRGLKAIMHASRRPLVRSEPTLAALSRAAPAVTKLSRILVPVLPRVDATLVPNREIFATLNPYHCDIAGFGMRWRSLLGGVIPGLKGDFGPVTNLHTTVVSVKAVGGDAGPFFIPRQKPCPPGYGP